MEVLNPAPAEVASAASSATAEVAPSTPTGRSRSRLRSNRRSRSGLLAIGLGSPLVVGLVILVIWEILVAVGTVDKFWVSQPSQIVSGLYDWAKDGTLWQLIFATFRVTIIGMALSVGVGIIIGSLQAAWPLFDDVVGFFVDIIYALPKVVLLPVLLFAFGLGDTPEIALVFLLTVFIIIYGVRGAFRGLDTEITDAIYVMGGSTRDALAWGALPQMAPQLLAAIRTAFPLAWIGAVFAEFFGTGNGTANGLGQMIITSEQNFDAKGMMTSILVITALGALVDCLLRLAGQRLDAWRPRGAA
jgi:ABC-type nitrate/sulfonate/bicarbonate transport system permease component